MEGEGCGSQDKGDEAEAADSVGEADEAGSADYVDEGGEEGAAGSAGEEEQDNQIKMERAPQRGKRKAKAGVTKTKLTAKVPQCGCASICSAFLPRIPPAGVRLDEEVGLELLEWSHDLQWANFCKNHLRRLASSGLDMYTNVTKKELQKRLRLVFRYRADLRTLRTKKSRYFRRASRAPDSAR
jgi:hypothetical protein